MNKEELMKQLLDLYEQRDAIMVPCSQMIVDEYVKKLEQELKELL